VDLSCSAEQVVLL
jgi:hypothetical protein